MSLARALACALTVALSACDGCSSAEPSTDLGARRPQAAPVDPADEGLTPMGRANAHVRAVPEERERAARRATLLADGRSHGQAGRHAEALRSFEDALSDAGGPDAALHCEAGFQAIQLGQWPLARRHLEAGLTVAVQPRRRAACLYNLALVDEAEQDRSAAVRALRESLALRPNGAVARKLEALEAAMAESEAETEAEETAGTSAPEAREGAPLEELCPEPTCDREETSIPTRPEGWPELTFVTREGAELPMLETWLLARASGGWVEVAPVASSDLRDQYGALDASERISAVRFEEDRLVISVAGEFDEHADEAGYYFECEAEHPRDTDAVMACFDEATANLPPPDSWAFDLIFALVDGRPTLVERVATDATQAAAP